MKKKINYLFSAILIIILLYNQGPIIWSNYQMQGQIIEKKQAYSFNQNKSILFPPKYKIIALYWASWCGPCKIEMERLNNAIINEELDSKLVFAINPFEDDVKIKKFIKKNDYKFNFIQVQNNLNIRSTPTIVHIKNGKVDHISSGISIIGIYRAMWFLSGIEGID